MAEDFAFLSAGRLIELYRGKKLSPIEVLSETLRRLERYEGALNAFILYDPEPVEPRAHPGRQQRRQRCRGLGRDLSTRGRHRCRRVGPHSGRVLRHRRVEADPRPGGGLPAIGIRRCRPCRPDGADRRRRRADARREQRTGFARLAQPAGRWPRVSRGRARGLAQRQARGAVADARHCRADTGSPRRSRAGGPGLRRARSSRAASTGSLPLPAPRSNQRCGRSGRDSVVASARSLGIFASEHGKRRMSWRTRSRSGRAGKRRSPNKRRKGPTSDPPPSRRRKPESFGPGRSEG